MSKKANAFTIVELLIVIVVIAILAAISIVSYNGIQARAIETAATSDLVSIAKKMSLYYADKGVYPQTTQLTGDYAVKVNKNAFAEDRILNLIVCSLSPYTSFAVIATTKTGKKLYITNSTGSVREYTGGATWAVDDATGMCQTVLSGSTFYGLGGYRNTDGWRPWTNAT